MSNKVKELNNDIQELRSLLDQAKRRKVQDVLTVELRRLETALITLKEQEVNMEAAGDVNKGKVPSTGYVVRIKDYAWDQSDKFVKFYVTINGVHTLESNKVTLSCEPRKFELTASDLNGKSYVVGIENLLSDIDVEKSYHKVKSDMVVVFLKKVSEGNKWSFVTMTEKMLNDQKAIKTMKDDKPDAADPTGGLMSMMKKMYEDGDDNMKREIAKAWTQANDKKSTGGAESLLDL